MKTANVRGTETMLQSDRLHVQPKFLMKSSKSSSGVQGLDYRWGHRSWRGWCAITIITAGRKQINKNFRKPAGPAVLTTAQHEGAVAVLCLWVRKFTFRGFYLAKQRVICFHQVKFTWQFPPTIKRGSNEEINLTDWPKIRTLWFN